MFKLRLTVVVGRVGGLGAGLLFRPGLGGGCTEYCTASGEVERSPSEGAGEVERPPRLPLLVLLTLPSGTVICGAMAEQSNQIISSIKRGQAWRGVVRAVTDLDSPGPS